MSSLAIGADGWIPGIPRQPSPNCSPRPPAAAVSLVVIHGISLPPRQFGGDAVARLFTNTLDHETHPYYRQLNGLRVSAHFFIRRDGAMVQFVSTEACAWHAGESAWRGRRGCNDFSLGIELEGCDDIPYDARQYPPLADLILALAQRYPPLAVVGHSDIAPQRKTDPGDSFSWPTLFNLIGKHYDGRART